MIDDFTTVTEVPGLKASSEQLAMLYTRYAFAAERCRDQYVLEVACGAGLGLGCLAQKAKKVIGGDYTKDSVHKAQQHYRARLSLLRLDAQALPFQSHSFDVVLLYEALYYLVEPERFLGECRRVLRGQGVLLLSTINREWPEFNPSPFSYRYFSAREIAEFLRKHAFHVELYGAFPMVKRSMRQEIISALKRLAVAWHLIPKTMKGKELLKRLFFGPLVVLPPEIQEGMATYCTPVPIPDQSPTSHFKVLFAIGHPC